MKATEGATHRDSKYQTYLNEARKRKIPVGAYHFISTASNAKAQFEHFKSIVPKEEVDLLPMIDFEKHTKGHHISGDSVRTLLREFVSLCKEYYGRAPLIYSGDAILCSLQSDSEDCPLWTSEFNHEPKVAHVIHQIGIFEIPGAKGGIDVNILKCPLDSLMLPKHR